MTKKYQPIKTLKATLFSTASFFIFTISPASASDQMSMEEIQAQLKLLSAQVATLTEVVEQQSKTIERQEAELASQKKENATKINTSIADIQPGAEGLNSIKVSMSPAPKIETKDGQFSFQPIARMNFDVTSFNDDMSDRSNGTNMRRARFGAKGKLGNDLSYKAEVDFGGNDVELTDFYLKYAGWDAADFVIGQQRPQMGLQQLTSANNIRFLERSAPVNALLQGRRLGLNVLMGDDNWSFGVGAFGEGAGSSASTDDEDSSVEARGTINLLPILNEDTDNVFHLGAAYSYRNPTDNETRFRARPGTGDGARIVDTGTITNVDTVDVYGLEVAGIFGPFHAQGEYINANVNRQNGAIDAAFDGFYAQAGYFLTGETLPYNGKSAKIGSVKPNEPFDLKTGGPGAWELVARFENLDLNDSDAGVTGGEVDIITGGVNWYLNQNLRLMGNVITVDSDNNAVVANDDPTIYSLRAQFNF